MTEREKIINSLMSATQLYNAAATKQEADQRYKLLRETLQKYHNTLWGKPAEAGDKSV